MAFVGTGFCTELSGSPEELKTFLQSDRKLVRVNGESELVAYSDTASVTVVVSTKAKTLSEALNTNSQFREGITLALLDSQFTAESINNAEFSSSPQYGFFGKQPNSYEVVNRITVDAKSEQQLQTISKIVDDREHAVIGSVEFSDSIGEQRQTQVELEALDDATETAKRYAEKLGMKLVPISFSFERTDVRQSNSSMVIEEIVVTAQPRGRGAAYAAPMRPASSFDEIRYKSKVTVTFEVAD